MRKLQLIEEQRDEIVTKTAEVVGALIEKAVADAGEQGNMLHVVSVDRLRGFIERIERLREEITALNADINEVKSEAKAEGYDVGTIGDIIKLRSLDDYKMKLGLLQTYANALGMEWPS